MSARQLSETRAPLLTSAPACPAACCSIQALHQSNGTFDSKFGSLGSALGEFNSPQYMALGTDNQTLLVSEAANYR